ncbi:hypothetical protein LguiB_011951 [Lonicera macranthoides]
MLNNKSRPIGKFISSSGDGSIITTTIPLKSKILSPISLTNYQSEKVGLGIVAALESSEEAKTGLYSWNLIRSNPIPVVGSNKSGGEIEEVEMEEYTYVTCHGPEESYTRVYCDGGRYTGNGGFGRRCDDKRQRVCLFDISPARFDGVTESPDFLSFWERRHFTAECRHSQISMNKRKAKCITITSSISSSPSSPYSYSTTKNKKGEIFSPGILAI